MLRLPRRHLLRQQHKQRAFIDIEVRLMQAEIEAHASRIFEIGKGRRAIIELALLICNHVSFCADVPVCVHPPLVSQVGP